MMAQAQHQTPQMQQQNHLNIHEMQTESSGKQYSRVPPLKQTQQTPRSTLIVQQQQQHTSQNNSSSSIQSTPKIGALGQNSQPVQKTTTTEGSFQSSPGRGKERENIVMNPHGTMLQQQHQLQQQMQLQQPQKQMVIHETFSIPMLERKMLFLNEPSLQTQSNQSNDQIRNLWRVHYKQMLNMQPQSEQGTSQSKNSSDLDPKRPDSIDEIGGVFGFSAPGQRPKDYNQFQNAVRNQLKELTRAHKDLRSRFKQAGTEVDKDIKRIETLTDHIQQVFNDFVQCFNSFVQREERLETLHHQAIKKSKELSKKIQLEVMAQSSQRSQLLAIVDDLTIQLKEKGATTVPQQALKTEQQAHLVTREQLEEKDKQIEAMEKEIKAQKASLQQLGQSIEAHRNENGKAQDQTDHFKGIIEEQNNHIDDLIQRKGQLEQEVSKLKSQIELTQSSKDKIILKLKQEMRMHAQAQPGLNLTGTLNASAIGANLNNVSAQHQYQQNNTSQSAANNAAALAANKQQIHQFQSQMQLRQQQQQQQVSSQQQQQQFTSGSLLQQSQNQNQHVLRQQQNQ